MPLGWDHVGRVVDLHFAEVEVRTVYRVAFPVEDGVEGALGMGDYRGI